MRRLLLTVVHLSLASALHRRPGVAAALRLRGGLLGVSPVAVGSAASILGATSGFYCGCIPAPACAAYGIDAPSPSTVTMCRALGLTNIAHSTLALAALKGTAIGRAVGLAWLPFLVGSTLEASKEGTPTRRAVLLAVSAISATVVIGAIGRAPAWPSALTLILGLLAALAPRLLAGAVGAQSDGTVAGMTQNFGNQLTAFAVLQLLLARGLTGTTAIGCSWAVALLGLLHMTFVTKAHAAMGVSKEGTVYPWLVAQPAIIAFSLF